MYSALDEQPARAVVYRVIARSVPLYFSKKTEIQNFIWHMILFLWKQDSNEITFFTRPEFSDVDSLYNDEWYPACDIHVTSPLAQRGRRPGWTHSFLFNKLDAKQ